MEFMSRVTQPQPQPSRMSGPAPVESPRAGEHGPKRHPREDLLSKGSWIGTNALLFVVALLVAAVVWLIYTASPATQSRYVNSNKLQAVFLNTGQVYFGNIHSINKEYLVLTNVYYLQSNNTSGNNSSNQNISLVKLGCELHRPYDTMVVNLTQVTFWENLQSDGQVGKAVAQFQQQNPNGQKCSDQPASSSNNLQNQATTNKQ